MIYRILISVITYKLDENLAFHMSIYVYNYRKLLPERIE